MAARKLGSVLALVAAIALLACGEAEETCTCTCTCGSGQKTTLSDVDDEEDCSSQCGMSCGNDSYTTDYDCTTSG